MKKEIVLIGGSFAGAVANERLHLCSPRSILGWRCVDGYARPQPGRATLVGPAAYFTSPPPREQETRVGRPQLVQKDHG